MPLRLSKATDRYASGTPTRKNERLYLDDSESYREYPCEGITAYYALLDFGIPVLMNLPLQVKDLQWQETKSETSPSEVCKEFIYLDLFK